MIIILMQHVQMMKLVFLYILVVIFVWIRMYILLSIVSAVGPHNKPIGARQFENLEHDGREFGSFKQTIIFLFAYNSVLGTSLQEMAWKCGCRERELVTFGNIFPCEMKTNDCGHLHLSATEINLC